jgi:hypothetical protein
MSAWSRASLVRTSLSASVAAAFFGERKTFAKYPVNVPKIPTPMMMMSAPNSRSRSPGS